MSGEFVTTEKARGASLHQAAELLDRAVASEEARLATEAEPDPWTAPMLANWLGGIRTSAQVLRDAAVEAEGIELVTEKAQVRNLATEVIGVDYPEGYVYVGSGDHLVLLCEMNVPKWRNSFALTPDSARRLAADLIRMADQSEQVLPPESPAS